MRTHRCGRAQGKHSRVPTQHDSARRVSALPLNVATASTTSWFVLQRLSTVLCSSGETGSGIGAFAASQLGGKQRGEELVPQWPARRETERGEKSSLPPSRLLLLLSHLQRFQTSARKSRAGVERHRARSVPAQGFVNILEEKTPGQLQHCQEGPWSWGSQ